MLRVTNTSHSEAVPRENRSVVGTRHPHPMTVAFLGWNSETWTPLIAALAVAIATIALIYARRTAKATDAQAAATARATDIAERALAFERQRSHREESDYTERVAPRWEATELDARGEFQSDDASLRGSLRNAGLTGATVVAAALDVGSGRFPMEVRAEGTPNGDWEAHPHVPPGSVLELRCALASSIRGRSRPMIYMDYEAPGLNHPPFGVTIELVRRPADARGQTRWHVGPIREDLRP
jgi:hypothetical protein